VKFFKRRCQENRISHGSEFSHQDAFGIEHDPSHVTIENMNSNAYQLYASPRSPFARRIRLALRRLELPLTETFLDVFVDNPEFWKQNPIGTLPTLITPDAGTLSDSSHLLEYLHEKTGKIWPKTF